MRRRSARQRIQRKTAERDYGGRHQKTRAQWQPIVAAGQATCCAIICVMPSRWIPAGAPWDLGHTADRTAYTGPEHRRCNRADGARRGNQQRGQRRAMAKAGSTRPFPVTVTAPLRTSRNW